jgi:hypothetical protein
MNVADPLDRIIATLTALGWITGAEFDRQDITLRWTAEGRRHFPAFLRDYQRAGGDEEELRYLAENLHYFGIARRGAREQLAHDVGDWLRHVAADTIVVIDARGGATRSFAKSDVGALLDHLAAIRRGGMTLGGNTITVE